MSTISTQKLQALQLEGFMRREKYIRYAGIMLTLSPLGNFFWSAALSGVRHWYWASVLFVFAKHVPGALLFLWSSTFVAGLQMLKGKRSSWTFTLLILGMNFIFGVISYKRDIQYGWIQPTISLFINIGLFALIYTQEFHQRLERKLWQARMNRPFSLEINSDLKINFDGVGFWASIVQLTHTGFKVRSVDGSAPRNIEFKTIELTLGRDIALKAKFQAKVGSDYVFRFVDMNPRSLAGIHRWAQKIASRPGAAGFKSLAA